ncbi:MAG: spore germination protein GerW family protein [Atribacterota bacterium]
MKEEITKQVEMLFEKLKDFITSKTVVGEEIKIGKLTLIPIIEVTFGMGSGTGGGKDAKDQEGSGEGMGLGVKARPSAFIVIKDEEVELLSLHKPGSLEKLIEKFPEIMEKFPRKPGKMEGKEEKKE